MKKIHNYQFRKGMTPWNKGLKGAQVAWNKGLRYMPDDEHSGWKGDLVGYISLHQWIKRKLGKPLYCSNNRSHIAKRFVWSNISGKYTRDLMDWRSLCNSCNLRDGIKIKNQFDEQRHRRIYA